MNRSSAAASAHLEGPGRRQRGVRIEQADERRAIRRHAVEHLIRHLATFERVRVETPAEEPVPVVQRLEFRGQALLDLGERAAAAEVRAPREREAEHRVDVAVDESGEDDRTGQVEHLCAIADEALQLGTIADAHDSPVGHGDTAGALGCDGVARHRDDRVSDQDGLGDGVRAHRSSPTSPPPISANRSGRVERRTRAYTIPATRTRGTTDRMTVFTAEPAAVR